MMGFHQTGASRNTGIEDPVWRNDHRNKRVLNGGDHGFVSHVSFGTDICRCASSGQVQHTTFLDVYAPLQWLPIVV